MASAKSIERKVLIACWAIAISAGVGITVDRLARLAELPLTLRVSITFLAAAASGGGLYGVGRSIGDEADRAERSPIFALANTIEQVNSAIADTRDRVDRGASPELYKEVLNGGTELVNSTARALEVVAACQGQQNDEHNDEQNDEQNERQLPERTPLSPPIDDSQASPGGNNVLPFPIRSAPTTSEAKNSRSSERDEEGYSRDRSSGFSYDRDECSNPEPVSDSSACSDDSSDDSYAYANVPIL